MTAMNDVPPVPSSEITPEQVYLNRRSFMKTGVKAGVLAATAVGTGLLYRRLNPTPIRRAAAAPVQTEAIDFSSTAPANDGFTTTEAKTSLEDITHYNNFYEFSTNKDGVAEVAAGFNTANWKLEVTGLCSNPTTLDLDALRKLARPEERVYRMRCVEGWSMVIPWAGYSLSKLLEKVAPLASAKYVAFQTLLDPERMPGQKSDVLNWPYVEGLRLDEAMHSLTLLASGLYGRTLPPQDGAPIRLVIPWKYGFKGIKSIVKISLVDKQPPTSWNLYAPREYGFYANVNPNHDHPRWSQADERRIGESGRRPTLMFNGYEEQVAGLYKGMDLDKDY
jgi:sulfoxide reductase catalytic subunit YedY